MYVLSLSLITDVTFSSAVPVLVGNRNFVRKNLTVLLVRVAKVIF